MLLAREQLLIEEGRKEGMAQGMAQGMAESAIKFIKNALRTLSPEEVSKTLDVSLEEVLRVASEKNNSVANEKRFPCGVSFLQTVFQKLYWSSFLVTLCSEIMLYIETPLVSYSYSLNEVSHSCTS